MTIAEGFKAVHQALFGAEPGQIQPSGHCDRCKAPLRIGPTSDCNAQARNEYEFHLTEPLPGSLCVFNGRMGETFRWKATLCDQCCYGLWGWLHGQKLGPWDRPNTGCNQYWKEGCGEPRIHSYDQSKFCAGHWHPVEVQDNGEFYWQCDTCGHRRKGILE